MSVGALGIVEDDLGVWLAGLDDLVFAAAWVDPFIVRFRSLRLGCLRGVGLAGVLNEVSYFGRLMVEIRVYEHRAEVARLGVKEGLELEWVEASSDCLLAELYCPHEYFLGM